MRPEVSTKGQDARRMTVTALGPTHTRTPQVPRRLPSQRVVPTLRTMSSCSLSKPLRVATATFLTETDIAFGVRP
jgi:hypothetical protein